MVHSQRLLLAACSLVLLVNGDWGSRETSKERGRWQQQPINISGTLVTHNCNANCDTVSSQCNAECTSYTIENISINRQIKQIKLYALPGKTGYTIDAQKPTIRTISNDPAKFLDTSNIDLVEIKSLATPFPTVTWIYEEQPGKGRKQEFIQIDITLADGSTRSYLAPQRFVLYCDENIKGSGPQEKDVPLTAIKKLTITGYKHNEPVEPAQKQVATPVKPAVGQTAPAA